MPKNKTRCDWPASDQDMITYHDKEWGVAVHNDKKHFEFLTLDAFQAGLSWQIILKKREGFRKAFDNFDYKKIARYKQSKIDRLKGDETIVRNLLKIESTISNAKSFMAIQKEFGSFDKYIWGFVNGVTKHNRWKSMSQIPASTPESDAMSADLKKRGFKFVGTTICYAYMQAAGLVNDHIVTCFRYGKV
ncbi:DNA-3-methyladenine glycosylase I [bacterium]|nr:DNA-3-methyladenine glycosylase I [bacterium]|tara:strand:+ start:13 stop:582 length:570 start_codon:yes stop_codon:yes gene_type:complete